MKIELKEHVVPKQTQYGTVERSLNQHLVFIENDEKQMIHCGYIGVHAFLPLSGFPNELCPEVARIASEMLDRPVSTIDAPLSIDKIVELAEQQGDDDE